MTHGHISTTERPASTPAGTAWHFDEMPSVMFCQAAGDVSKGQRWSSDNDIS